MIRTKAGADGGHRAIVRCSLSVRVCVVMALWFAAGVGGTLSGAADLPEPPNLNIRIIGTASFQGRWSALIEDVNSRSDSFYTMGDPLYGYRISAIETGGIYLEKAQKKYFVPIKSTAVRAMVTPGKEPKVIVQNTYLPNSQSASAAPNYYLDTPKTTQWDYYIPAPVEAVAAAAPQDGGPAPAMVVAKVSLAPERGGRFAFPLASFKKLTSGFGYRRHPIGGGTKMHKGVDLAATKGTKIFSADAGTVIWSGWRGGYGYCVMIDHHNGYVTVYGHCSRLLTDVGDNVRRGEYIAQVGSTGASTGSHLHFEVQRNKTPIDPRPFFKGIL